jgi:hypothetical protein
VRPETIAAVAWHGTETEQWLDLHKLFGLLSGFDAKIDDPRKRFITTLFCYGCNLGPSQTARSVKGLTRKQVAWLNLKHITEERLDQVQPPRREYGDPVQRAVDVAQVEGTGGEGASGQACCSVSGRTSRA